MVRINRGEFDVPLLKEKEKRAKKKRRILDVRCRIKNFKRVEVVSNPSGV